MEDTLHLCEGVPAPGNAAFVKRTTQLINDLNRLPSTVEETRSMLHVPSA